IPSRDASASRTNRATRSLLRPILRVPSSTGMFAVGSSSVIRILSSLRCAVERSILLVSPFERNLLGLPRGSERSGETEPIGASAGSLYSIHFSPDRVADRRGDDGRRPGWGGPFQWPSTPKRRDHPMLIDTPPAHPAVVHADDADARPLLGTWTNTNA